MDKKMLCRICASLPQEMFRATILRKYDIAYYYCDTCGFLQTQEPFWLQESYAESMTLPDTGGLLRSLSLAEVVSVLIYFIFDRNAQYLDFAGGYGIFTRRMRDIGFDFYWLDRYSPNLLARGFEYTQELGNVELITSFESFEHFVEPNREIKTMLALSKNLIFTTEVLPTPVPRPEDWYYYGLQHGQHISFYSLRTLHYLADSNGLKLYSVPPLHILTEKAISSASLRLLLALRKFGLFFFIKRRMKSRTVGDSIALARHRSS
ncbi:MAG TPA: methyltransferase type 11 [Nitrospiraceae bacterium]|jgi:hypothetical protein|nr:methyltransferase type 11 [Nitrospiraceae bacterium]